MRQDKIFSDMGSNTYGIYEHRRTTWWLRRSRRTPNRTRLSIHRWALRSRPKSDRNSLCTIFSFLPGSICSSLPFPFRATPANIVRTTVRTVAHYILIYRVKNIFRTRSWSYHNFGGVLAEPNAGERIGDRIEIDVLSVETVAHHVTADDFVLAHLHHALYGRFWFGLENGRRRAVHRQLFQHRRAHQQRTDHRTGIHLKHAEFDTR